MDPLSFSNGKRPGIIVRGSDQEYVQNTHCCGPLLNEIIVENIDGKLG